MLTLKKISIISSKNPCEKKIVNYSLHVKKKVNFIKLLKKQLIIFFN